VQYYVIYQVDALSTRQLPEGAQLATVEPHHITALEITPREVMLVGVTSNPPLCA
jgi:hypothetical protein